MIEKAVASSSENNTFIQIHKMTEHALTPTWESPRSAGFDLLIPYDMTVPAKRKELIRTDLQMKLLEGCYGRITPRTDLALLHHMSIGAGVTDKDFRGNLSVLL
jgi:dUTP pyrophosphatase